MRAEYNELRLKAMLGLLGVAPIRVKFKVKVKVEVKFKVKDDDEDEVIVKGVRGVHRSQ